MPLEGLRVKARASKNRLVILLRLGVDPNWSNALDVGVRATLCEVVSRILRAKCYGQAQADPRR